MYERMLHKEEKPTMEDLSLYVGASADLFHELTLFYQRFLKQAKRYVFHMGKNMVGV